MINIKWYEKYYMAEAYYKKYGNLEVPVNFYTNDGITKLSEGDFDLGTWLKTQRARFSKLEEVQQNMLLKIGFVKNVHDETWDFFYDLLYKYSESHGTTFVDMDFLTFDGVHYDKNGYKLGSWTATQRMRFNKMRDDRKQKLISIGFVTNHRDADFEKHFEFAKAFYDYHHHLQVPQNFRTFNGYDEDPEGFALGRWVSLLRVRYDDLTEYRKKMLDSIDFKLEARESNWDKKFLLFKDYYENNHTSNIPFAYTTGDGIRLGRWISNQRVNFKELPKEKKQMLYENGFIIDCMKNRLYVESLIYTYGIDNYFEWRNVISVSMQELQSKIMYLIDHNIPLTYGDVLNEIFRMNNYEMFEKFGIALEDLIRDYSIDVDDACKLVLK